MISPKVFISYSHDSQEHKDWVYKLACDLMQWAGVEVILDQWDLDLGSNLPRFMHDSMDAADRVLVVCTDNYISKSNGAKGGAGYEGAILTAELFRQQESTKYIPLIRGATGTVKVPHCLDGRVYTDFSSDDDYSQRFLELKHEIHGVPLRPKPKKGPNPFEVEIDSRPRMNMADEEYFGLRFGESFPGIRELVVFDDPEEATNRLCHFLSGPFEFQDGTPYWWWRGNRSLHISSFERTGSSAVLMNTDELNIKSVAVSYSSVDCRKFIYVECVPSEATGVNGVNSQWLLDNLGYVYERFAVFNGRYITAAEADDGATLVDGLPVSVRGKVIYRTRFLSPYNFVIAPNGSAINHVEFDDLMERILNRILNGAGEVNDLCVAVNKLPRRSARYRD